jgi:hypothetical protein
MYRRGRTGEIVNLVYFYVERKSNVVPQELKRRRLQKVRNVPLRSGKAIVGADDIVALADQPIAEVASEEPCPAGNKNSFVI